MQFLSIWLFLCGILTLYAQKNPEVDALIEIYKTTNSSDSMLWAIEKATKLSESNGYYEYLPTCYYGMAYSYKDKNNWDSSFNYINKAIQESKKLGKNEELLKSYNLLSELYIQKGDYENAFKTLQSALKMENKIPDHQYFDFIYINLGYVLVHNYDTIGAKYYYKQCIENSLKNEDYNSLNSAYFNISNLYKDDFDSASYYLNKSLDLSKKLNLKDKEVDALNNFAIYILNAKRKNDYPKAHNYLKQAEKIAKENNFIDGLFTNYFNQGFYYSISENNSTKSIEYYKKSLNHYQSQIDVFYKMHLYEKMSYAYKDVGDYKTALDYQEKFHTMRDSLFGVEKEKAIASLNTKYEVEKKNSTIKLLTKQKEIEESKKRNILIISLFLLLFLVGALYFYSHKAKTQEILRHKEQEIATKELETKSALSLINGQEQERKRLSEELHDGLGAQLSAIKLKLASLSPQNMGTEKNKLESQLSSSIKNLRHISHDLSIKQIEKRDFSEQLTKLAYDSFPDMEIEVSIFPIEQINTLDEMIKMQLYRIIQESFQNISKHAKAKEISFNLVLNKSANQLNLLIEDDGVGFDVNKEFGGIGLQNIMERVKVLKGEITIDSELNKGTLMNISIPT